MEKQKVLHVLGGFNYGGAEQFLLNLYQCSDRDRLQYDALTRSEATEQTNAFIRLGGQVYVTSCFPRHIVRNFCDVKNFLKNYNADYEAIHIHANALIYIVPIVLAKHYGFKKIILHSHNTKAARGAALHYLNRWCLKYVDIYLACGKQAGHWMFGERKYNLIHNGIRLERYVYNHQIAQRKKKELGLNGRFVIGHVGRFVKQKNHKKIVDVFVEVRRKKEEAALLLIGDGELKGNIVEYLKEKGVYENTVILSKRQDIPELLQCMDVFLFPSFYEGLSIALIEAQTTGLNCVISNSVDYDSVLCSNVKMRSVMDSDQMWAKTVLSFGEDENRNLHAHLIVEKSGYNMENTVSEMMKIYGIEGEETCSFT